MASPLPASPADVRLSDLSAWSVPVQWHEAVAVVRQLGAQATHGVPSLDAIWLTTDGTIRLDPGTRPTSGSPVIGLATVLRALLPASAPADLLTLADPDNQTIQESSAREFIEALTFFARPDDFSELRALYEKTLDARLAAERTAALQSLTERARHAGPAPAADPHGSAKPLKPRRLPLVAAALAVMVAGGAGAWWALASGAPAPAPSAGAAPVVESPARRVQQSLASAAAFVTETLTGTPPQSPGRGADVELPAPRQGRGHRRSGNGALSPTLPVADAAGAGEVKAPDAPGLDVVLPSRVLPSADGLLHALAAAPHGVYSAANPDVLPPAIVRPQMPEVPLAGVPAERPGHLELVVDEGGQVTSAKLVPVSNRHQDRMMVSAAKTWRFQPAMRFGQAVRYRLQIPITW